MPFLLETVSEVLTLLNIEVLIISKTYKNNIRGEISPLASHMP
jgi:hypothetical protein